MRLLPISRRADIRPVLVEGIAARGRGRVAATVAGRSVWFESSDLPLAEAAEAFGSAFLVPAMHARRQLHVPAGGCPTWTANTWRIAETFRDLWYSDAPPPLCIATRQAAATRATPAATSTALCFTGGVDAFHTFLENQQRVDRLVYVVGYDVKLRHRRRAADVSRMIRSIAAEVGTASALLRTNLRQHPLMRATPWGRSFGGALAAIGHLLGDSAATLIVSGDGLGYEHPEVGSRSGTDHLFGSATTSIEHFAPTVTRLEKIRRIAGEPIVQQHLRVCWQNVGDRLNCGRCEKCVRTMLSLEACGALAAFPGFNGGRGLIDVVDSLAEVDNVVSPFYRNLLEVGLTGRAAEGVKRLLARSGMPNVSNRSSSRRPHAGLASHAAHPGPAERPSSRPAVSPAATRHRLLGPEAFAPVCEPLVGKRVGYVRPVGNVGDHLIEMAMAQLFATYGIRWSLVDLDAGPRGVEATDLLVFGGGGNMGTRYGGNHAIRGEALATGLPVVILPQSFTSPEDRPFARVYVREQTSLGLHPGGTLAPDLALGLAWPAPAAATRGLGIFLRRDQERGGRKPLFARDPIRLSRTPAEYLAFAARYQRIITDRLHFAVAGLHAGRDVTLVANDYHKNRSMHDTWLADLGCRFAESPASALHRGRRAA